VSASTVPLSDVVEIRPQSIDPSAFPQQDFYLLSIPAFDNGRQPERVQGREVGSTKYRLTAPSVLVSKINPRIKRIWCVGKPDPKSWICSTEFVPLVPTVGHIDLGYLEHFLLHTDIEGLTASSSQAATKSRQRFLPRSLLSLNIPLPPLHVQRRIVGLLDRVVVIRRHADAARTKVRAIIPALFLDIFGDPATNHKGWPTLTLGEAISSGPQNGLYKPATDYGDGVRILRIDSFDNSTIAYQGALKRLRIDEATIEKFRLEEGDVVVNRVNSPPQLGKSVLIPRLEEPIVFESNMMRMRVNSAILAPPVLGVMLQLDSVRQALIKNAKHAINQSSINQRDVTGIRVLAPPVVLQTAFAEHVQRLEALARHLDAAATKADAMAAALSAEVFD
jgi:type I restriction enzyme, S subunit